MRHQSRIIGLIPARGGSQGIPRKNIKPLGGKPLIAYTIESALQTKGLDAVCVSTEDLEIAEVARQCGADVPFIRPVELATASASSVDVMLHTLDFYRNRGQMFDAICLLQPTCPFRSASQIEKAIALWRGSDVEAVISVLPVPPTCHPYWVMFTTDGLLTPAISKGISITRRQDLPPAYQRSGSIYLITSETLCRTHSLFSGNVAPLVHDDSVHVNLDSLSDWNIAESMVRQFKTVTKEVI